MDPRCYEDDRKEVSCLCIAVCVSLRPVCVSLLKLGWDPISKTEHDVSSGEYLNARSEHDGARHGEKIFQQKNTFDASRGQEIFQQKNTRDMANTNLPLNPCFYSHIMLYLSSGKLLSVPSYLSVF